MRVHNLLRKCCRLLPRAALLSALILASGCGSKYAKVSGKVLHKGEPLPGGVIQGTVSAAGPDGQPFHMPGVMLELSGPSG